MARRKTTEQFIAKAKLVHGDRYDYSRTMYTTRDAKVTIGCQIHGYFEQIAGNHIRGSNCSKCMNDAQRKTRDEIIKGLRDVHGDYYQYDLIDGIEPDNMITIRCRHHGIFRQKHYDHANGSGCAECAGLKRKDTKQFIDEAKQLHGNRWDYSKTIYVNTKTPVIIGCPIHGDFNKRPLAHLKDRQGCPKCAKAIYAKSLTSNTNEWIEKSRLVHGDLYDYSKSNYVSATTPVEIICKSCGSFYQRPSGHLAGYGCPKCVHRVSKESQRWLDSLDIKDDPDHREVNGLIKGKNYSVDGYDPITKTVYEYHGDYWHGNPDKYDPDDVNPTNGRTYGELYERTVEKRQRLIDAGFQYIEIWESEWLAKS